MKAPLKSKLQVLAATYENKSFLQDDPSQFMTNYKTVADKEIAAFLAATLAFGRREQIISHVNEILSTAGKSPAQWISCGLYKNFFPDNNSSFYRVFTNRNMRELCRVLQTILLKNKTLGAYFLQQYEKATALCPYMTQKNDFHKANGTQCDRCELNPFLPNSTLKCKRVPLFKIIQNTFIGRRLWQSYSKGHANLPAKRTPAFFTLDGANKFSGGLRALALV